VIYFDILMNFKSYFFACCVSFLGEYRRVIASIAQYRRFDRIAGRINANTIKLIIADDLVSKNHLKVKEKQRRIDSESG